METSSVLNSGTQDTASDTMQAIAGSEGSISDLFTTLLVAQIRNQNPLEPTDPSDFVNQLTQLSQVESLQSLAQQTGANAAILGSLQVLALGAQVGSEIMVNTSSFNVGSEAVRGVFTLESSSAKTTMVLTGPDGVDRRIDLGTHAAGEVDFVVDPAELGLPAGAYTMKIETETGETPLTEIAGRLVSVRMAGSGDVALNISGLGEVSPSYITRFNGRTATSVN
ncbi:MAG: flagellar basal body rod modification protein [Gammaproteobacteria bacterium]|jgi:flagellar basal-body rod modification protein FlgD|nr:flagellar basal body rod modification protein [Gammaproteobacteria bacterium]MBU0773473.1 flagellar basal body rod modification protein [Gammaproteobacteria bacterium]MBU0856683.1 flagellar basal body rod modification protein [Gammaproteobacteria bacterium]MBU1846787.1 flagellar basal body rod modification protein [Gammaproteobacteria bacterium]